MNKSKSTLPERVMAKLGRSAISLREYIGLLHNEGRFIIPDYQRGYIWGQKKKDEPSARAGKGRAKPERYAQYYAEISRRFLQQTAAGKKVTLRAEKQEKDKQGRILCDLELGDGTTLSSRMVRSGCAYVVYDPDFPKAYQQNLLEQQTDAIHARRGFWSLILSGSAAGRTFTGDSATRLFYSSTDVRGLRLKPRMRVYFGNLLDAFSSGYAPARSTDFWPVNLRVSEGKKKDRKR